MSLSGSLPGAGGGAVGGKHRQDKIRRYYSMIASAHSGPLDEKLVKSIPGLGKIIEKEKALLNEKVATKRKGDEMAMILKEQGNAFMQQILALQRQAQQSTTVPCVAGGVALHNQQAASTCSTGGGIEGTNFDSPEPLYATHGIMCYSQALYKCEIKAELLKAQLHANRAQAFIVLKQFSLGLMDAETAMALQPNFVKAYYRAATCSRELGNLTYAEQLLIEGLERERAQNPEVVHSDLQALLTYVKAELKTMGVVSEQSDAAEAPRPATATEQGTAGYVPPPTAFSHSYTTGASPFDHKSLTPGGPSAKRPTSAEHAAAMEILGEETAIGLTLPDMEDPEEFNRMSVRVGVATVVKRYYWNIKRLYQSKKVAKADLTQEDVDMGAMILTRSKDALITCKDVHHAAFSSKPQRKKLDRLIDEVQACLIVAVPAVAAGLLFDENAEPVVSLTEPLPAAPTKSGKKGDEKDAIVFATTNNGKNYLECDRWLQAFLVDSAFIPQNVLEHSVKQQIAQCKSRFTNRKTKIAEMQTQIGKDKKRQQDQSRTLEKARRQLLEAARKEAEAETQMNDYQEFKRSQALEQEGSAGDVASAASGKKKLLAELKAQSEAAETAATQEGEELEHEISALEQKQEAARARVKLVATLQAARLRAIETKKAEEAEARRKEMAAAKKEKERLEMLSAKAAAAEKSAVRSQQQQQQARAETSDGTTGEQQYGKQGGGPIDKEAIKERAKLVPLSSVPTIDGAPAKYCERKGEGKKDYWLCYACDRQYSSFEGVRQHVRGNKHKEMLLALDPPAPELPLASELTTSSSNATSSVSKNTDPVYNKSRQQQVAGHHLHIHHGGVAKNVAGEEVEPTPRRKPAGGSDGNTIPAAGWTPPPPPPPLVGPNGQPTIRVGGSFVVSSDAVIPVPGGLQLPPPPPPPPPMSSAPGPVGAQTQHNANSRLDGDAKPFIPAPRSTTLGQSLTGALSNPPVTVSPGDGSVLGDSAVPGPGLGWNPATPPMVPSHLLQQQSPGMLGGGGGPVGGLHLGGIPPLGQQASAPKPKMPRFFRSGTIVTAAWQDALGYRLQGEYPGCEFDITRPKFGKKAAISIAASSQTMLRSIVESLTDIISTDCISLDEEVYRELSNGDMELVGSTPQQQQNNQPSIFASTPTSATTNNNSSSAAPIGTFLPTQSSPIEQNAPSFTIFHNAANNGGDVMMASSPGSGGVGGGASSDWLESAMAGNAQTAGAAADAESLWLKGVLDDE